MKPQHKEGLEKIKVFGHTVLINHKERFFDTKENEVTKEQLARITQYLFDEGFLD